MGREQYFDNNGSTPVHERVARVFVQEMTEHFGNPGAAHLEGKKARAVVDEAKQVIAEGLGAKPEEIWFTSGGTEANNWALSGCAKANKQGKHLIVSAIEHKSVLRAAQSLEEAGYALSIVEPRRGGAVHIDDIKALIRDDTFLVSVMLANNETGVVQPAAEIGTLCRENNILYHCDAVAALGKLPLDVNLLQCDLLSLSSHKMYAPKACGVLFARQNIPLAPMIHGCGQQNGMRSGTENAAGVIAFAEAFKLLSEGAFKDEFQLRRLSDHLWQGIQNRFPSCQRNGAGPFLPNTVNVYFPNCLGVDLMQGLGELGFSVAAGAAATNSTPSHVLKAMGYSDARARGSLRFSLGATNTAESVEALLDALEKVHTPMLAAS
jgi:cysteine desulfurase